MQKINYIDVIENFTNENIKNYGENNKKPDHEQIANNFMKMFEIKSKKELCNLLACTGFIPDLYPADSGEETLFSKLVEAVVAVWAVKMGFDSVLIKEKSSYEDVDIVIGDKTIVCDAKSFRLGRSQAAPNTKDFLKLEDVRKWLKRRKNGLGGLVTYPNTHDWKEGGDVYLYCTTKDCPTIMLSYIHLALLLHFKNKYHTSDLIKLWDYERLFPQRIEKKIDGGNRMPYWNTIHEELISIMGINIDTFNETFLKYQKIQQSFILHKIRQLEATKEATISKIKEDINSTPDKSIRDNFINYRINIETKKIDECIKRIINFRLTKGEQNE